jgi:hypothetical protein
MPVSETETEVAKRLTDALAELEQAGNAAHEYGLRISDEAIREMNKLPNPENRVELALWLTRDEHFDVAHRLMGLTPAQQVEEIKALAKREDVVGSLKNGDTEDYIDARRRAKREGKRR